MISHVGPFNWNSMLSRTMACRRNAAPWYNFVVGAWTYFQHFWLIRVLLLSCKLADDEIEGPQNLVRKWGGPGQKRAMIHLGCPICGAGICPRGSKFGHTDRNRQMLYGSSVSVVHVFWCYFWGDLLYFPQPQKDVSYYTK
jgi:hypothetical protein